MLLLRAKALGGWLQTEFDVEKETTAEVYVELLNYVDRGIVDISLEGRGQGVRPLRQRRHLRRVPGRHTLTAGRHTLKLVATNWAQSTCATLPIGGRHEPVGEEKTGQPAGFHILPCDDAGSPDPSRRSVDRACEGGWKQARLSLIGSPPAAGREVGCYRMPTPPRGLRLLAAIAVADDTGR